MTPLSNGDYLWTSPLGHTYTTSGRSFPNHRHLLRT